MSLNKEKLREYVRGLLFDATSDLRLKVSYNTNFSTKVAWYWDPKEISQKRGAPKISTDFDTVEDAKNWAVNYRIMQLYRVISQGGPAERTFIFDCITEYFKDKPVGSKDQHELLM